MGKMLGRLSGCLKSVFCGRLAVYPASMVSESWAGCFPKSFLLLLKLTVSLTLLGRGWLIYTFDSKVRSLLWDEEIMTPVLKQWFGTNWVEYSETSYEWIDPSITWMGIVLMISATIPFLCYIPKCKWMVLLLLPSVVLISLENYGMYHDTYGQLGMLVEHSLQGIAPVALIMLVLAGQMKYKIRAWAFVISVAACLTFVGHGLYAMGYYPVPYTYQSMTMELLSCDEVTAKSVLKTAGYLDFLVAVMIFVPWTRRVGLYYMFWWGLATALARVITMYEPAQKWNGLNEGIGETLVRTSHWALPLLLLALLLRRKSDLETDKPSTLDSDAAVALDQ